MRIRRLIHMKGCHSFNVVKAERPNPHLEVLFAMQNIIMIIMYAKGLDSSRQVKSLKKMTKLLSLQNMF